jgi:two-component system, LytTR family, response regulator
MRIVLIEDEDTTREHLRQIIQKNCPQLEIVGEADTVEAGIEVLSVQKPNIAFMDVRLITGDAFDILQQLQLRQKIDFEIIFLTAYFEQEFVTQAFQYAAFDYLSKPFDVDKIRETVQRLEKKQLETKQASLRGEQLNDLFRALGNLEKKMEQPSQVEKPKTIERLGFEKQDGKLVNIRVSDIIYCKATGGGEMTQVFLTDKTNFNATKRLGHYEDILKWTPKFYRMGKSLLVNFYNADTYDAKDQVLKMSNGDSLPVSIDQSAMVKRLMREGF